MTHRRVTCPVRGVALLAALALAAVACAAATPTADPAADEPNQEPTPMAAPTSFPAGFALTSSSFAAGGPIPAEHSCRGADVSPPLAWSGTPAGTTALVLFVDDPDGRDWVHWSVLDLPAADGELPQGVTPATDPPQQGLNDFGRVGYGGPCPPSGTHHYRFTLYALGAPLGLAGHPDGTAVRAALSTAAILGTTTLVGTFRA